LASFLPSFPSAGEDRCRRRGDAAALYFPFLSFYLPDWIAPGRLRAALPFLDGNGWPYPRETTRRVAAAGDRPVVRIRVTMNLPATFGKGEDCVLGRVDFAAR